MFSRPFAHKLICPAEGKTNLEFLLIVSKKNEAKKLCDLPIVIKR